MSTQAFERPYAYYGYRLGADNCPIEVRSREAIVARDAVVDHVPYGFDTDAVQRVEVTEGGTATAVKPIENTPHYGVDIMFRTPLQPGHRRTIAYTTILKAGMQLPAEFRRVIAAKDVIKTLEMAVLFHPDAVPDADKIWQAVWDKESNQIIDDSERPARLHSNTPTYGPRFIGASLHQTDPIPNTIVGFHWQFPA